ncbi:MAG: LysR family transcriptional regulator [Gammaproteobacteria bacterium]|nr:LysR family transcriptional regulator [Gammaproteobacteria bacterium]
MHRFEDLRAFVAVVETGSFTAAADRLGIAKSATSRRMASLESRLGVQLLQRTTRRLNLTDTGRSFYERSARILADLEEAEAAVHQEHGELRGKLRIAMPLAFSISHMCEPIAEFARMYPKVTFDLDLNDRRVDLVQEGMDLALRIGHLSDSSLIARRLFDSHTVICASPAYVEEHGAPQTVEDLRDHHCLVYGNLSDPTRWVGRDNEGVEHRVDVRATLSASSGDFLAQLAARGRGIVMQPTFIAGALIRQGKLMPLLTDYQWPAAPAFAVYPPTRHLSFRVRTFIDFLVDYFSATPSWDEECEALSARQS